MTVPEGPSSFDFETGRHGQGFDMMQDDVRWVQRNQEGKWPGCIRAMVTGTGPIRVRFPDTV
jgi:hypothetical protein